MGVTTNGWANHKEPGEKACECGSWKEHWLSFAAKPWPEGCSVQGCSNSASVGGQVTNPAVTGVKIAPMCDTCNALDAPFNLDGGITLVNGNVAETCARKMAQA